jgi:hypothetical protein
MTGSCAQLQAEILATIATAAPGNDGRGGNEHRSSHHTLAGGANGGAYRERAPTRQREHMSEDEVRRLRQRRE